jgi:hypothetical protein
VSIVVKLGIHFDPGPAFAEHFGKKVFEKAHWPGIIGISKV